MQILILQQLVDSVHSQHPEQKIIFKIKKKNISVQILILQPKEIWAGFQKMSFLTSKN